MDYETSHFGNAPTSSGQPVELEEEYLSVAQVATMLNVSADTVARRFENEPGVIDLGHGETRYKRRYRLLRIPRSVLKRLINQRRVSR